MLRSIYNRLDALNNFIETVNDEDIKYTKQNIGYSKKQLKKGGSK